MAMTPLQRKKLEEWHATMRPWGTPEKYFADSGLWKWLPYVRTKDEHDQDNPIKPVPLDKDYVAVAFTWMLAYPQLAIPKSRQMLVSWMIAAFCCWVAWRRPHTLVIYQTKKEADAFAMVTRGERDPSGGRMSFIINNLPVSLADPMVRSGRGNKQGELLHLNGSMIMAVPQGEHQVRGHTPSLFVSDEAAFQEEYQQAHYAIRPAILGGGRLILASSANPGFFAQLLGEAEAAA